MQKRIFRLAIYVFAALALQAQITTTTISGTVSDASGGAIPNAQVTVSNIGTGATHTVTTNVEGTYRIDLLPVGKYEVEVSATGFKKSKQTGIELEVSRTARLDAVLSVGTVNEEVTITADAPLVNTSNAQIGRTTGNAEINNLPIVGRNVYTLLSLTPGVDSNANSIVLGYPEQRTMINGGVDGGAGSVNYFLDGGTNMTGLRNTGNIAPNPDAVEEFRVITNSYSAEFGRFASGVVNIITKSGTNTFHGSLFEFLRMKGWSKGAIEYYTVMNFVEADMHNAVIEILREDIGKAYVDMQEIAGGMDRLPNAFYAELHQEIRLGAEVFAIDQDPEGVTIHFKTEAGRFRARGDYAICTLPFPVLRTVETLKPFSHAKQRAIRELNYHASTKVLFQVRKRVWEADDSIFGGATVTDMAVRRMNYPTPDPATERGMLLASYTWGQDALQWGAMDEETRLEEALDDVARIHPRIREVYEVGASHAWYGDRWARGAFAMFAPEQQTELQADIVKPEGRVYFAGEHCSLYHAWIQGALESGIRAAREIHEAPTE